MSITLVVYVESLETLLENMQSYLSQEKYGNFDIVFTCHKGDVKVVEFVNALVKHNPGFIYCVTVDTPIKGHSWKEAIPLTSGDAVLCMSSQDKLRDDMIYFLGKV